MCMSLAAPAKLNLTLDVLEVRSDGYHELASVFASLALADLLTIRRQGPDGQIRLVTRGLTLPAGPGNSCLVAARRLAAGRSGLGGVELVLEKRIPVASGLGGGSADAAAALVGLNACWGLGLTPGELQLIAGEVGSDVPFCLKGGIALVRGRGDRLCPLPQPPLPLWLVLVRPPGAKATALVYRAFDQLPPGAAAPYRPDTRGAARALAGGDWEALAVALGNVLEAAVARTHPQVGRARRLLEQAGALGTAMTGSGPTVFGICRDEGQAREVAARVAAQSPSPRWWTGITRVTSDERSWPQGQGISDRLA